jgi:hypothetical protein
MKTLACNTLAPALSANHALPLIAPSGQLHEAICPALLGAASDLIHVICALCGIRCNRSIRIEGECGADSY